MFLSKYKRRPDPWNKHAVLHLESEAASFSADTAHLFRPIPWLLELDSGIQEQYFATLPSISSHSPKVFLRAECGLSLELSPRMPSVSWFPSRHLPLQIELVNTEIFFYTYNESSQFNGLKKLGIER